MVYGISMVSKKVDELHRRITHQQQERQPDYGYVFYELIFQCLPLQLKSGRRDSNPRPSAWEADALPTELLPLIDVKVIVSFKISSHTCTLHCIQFI